jgi:hypothetical protein
MTFGAVSDAAGFPLLDITAQSLPPILGVSSTDRNATMPNTIC